MDEVRHGFDRLPDLHLLGKVVGFEQFVLLGGELAALFLRPLCVGNGCGFFQQGVEIIKVFDGGGGDCSGAFCDEFFEVVEVGEWDFLFRQPVRFYLRYWWPP